MSLRGVVASLFPPLHALTLSSVPMSTRTRRSSSGWWSWFRTSFILLPLPLLQSKNTSDQATLLLSCASGGLCAGGSEQRKVKACMEEDQAKGRACVAMVCMAMVVLRGLCRCLVVCAWGWLAMEWRKRRTGVTLVVPPSKRVKVVKRGHSWGARSG